MPPEAVIEWGITLFIFGLLGLSCAQAAWPITPKGQPKEEAEQFPQRTKEKRTDIMNLNETYGRIEDLLAVELQTAVAQETISTRQTRREEIGKEIRNLTNHITTLNNRFRMLPELPPVHLVEWAQAVQRFSNLAFVVLDTTSVEDDADIIRVLVADRDGKSLLDQLVMPNRYMTANTQYTGIDSDKLFLAYRLAEVWPRVQEVLSGRYILAYNLDFVRNRLRQNAEHYGLPPITLIGECLQEKSRSYWGEYYPPKLVRLCERIGHTLPQPATAPDRVAGQLALLKAMSQGITDVAPVKVGAGIDEAFEPEDNLF